MSGPNILFVTGKLAEPSLRHMLEKLAPALSIDYSVAVLPITVVALATTEWVGRHLSLDEPFDKIVLPGMCRGELSKLQSQTSTPVVRGPNDLRDLPDFFESGDSHEIRLDKYDIAILAEINHARELSQKELLVAARSLRQDGADIIDLGCDPGSEWAGIGNAVCMLRYEGMRVSVDSFDPQEVESATKAGAELVLSVNSSNCHLAKDWGCEVVVIPDDPSTMAGIDETMEVLDRDGVPFRVDPIIEPIGFGFAQSLGRYLQTREKYPNAEIMMGVGNLTELTDVDSAGVNVMLLGFCQELGIRSVLTTQVINWCRSCVRELDLARRLVYYASANKTLPKHLEPNLVMLRDPKLRRFGRSELLELAKQIKDKNVRLFAEDDTLTLMNDQCFLEGIDPFEIFAQLHSQQKIDADHAFYLGYEMAKAITAITLGKNYVQDQPLDWGFLTRPETSHWHERTKHDRQQEDDE